VADRDAAVDAWRHAESVVYPSVMLNADLYQQYIQVIRAISDELRDVHTEDDLVRTWHEQQGLGAEAVDRMAPSMAILMNRDAVRDAAFCKRHREVMREHGKEIAQQRLLEARRTGAEWVVLFEDVTPFGSQRLEMHVRSGRAIHASAEIQPAGPASYELEVVQLDPRDGAWLLDKPPLMSVRRFDRRDEWEARVAQAREQFRKD
ncbi:MAG: hypothetical protein JO179_06355, partial [Solirubrobacterales bacterium]|nr:hypothetical protein [Solirubrobacterales bacterium]